jgi:ABC-2 type transport system ATP-binding protein
MMATIIEARGLVKRFDGFTAVDHISFAVPEGVIFAFFGPNGAGKTTTIKC